MPPLLSRLMQAGRENTVSSGALRLFRHFQGVKLWDEFVPVGLYDVNYESVFIPVQKRRSAQGYCPRRFWRFAYVKKFPGVLNFAFRGHTAAFRGFRLSSDGLDNGLHGYSRNCTALKRSLSDPVSHGRAGKVHDANLGFVIPYCVLARWK